MTREKLLEIFPEINYIKDGILRDKCIACWCEVLEFTGWEKVGIEKCPLAHGVYDDKVPETSLEHCRHVVSLCKAGYDNLDKWLSEKIGKIDEDALMAAAVLHDIGKFIECRYEDGKVVEDENGPLFRHPVSGAFIAQKHDLPTKIVHMILAHSNLQSPEGRNAFMTPELFILKQLDELCCNTMVLFSKY